MTVRLVSWVDMKALSSPSGGMNGSREAASVDLSELKKPMMDDDGSWSVELCRRVGDEVGYCGARGLIVMVVLMVVVGGPRSAQTR